MVNWESQSNTPPQSPEDGKIYCILLISIAFCHVSKKLPLHCLFDVTMNIISIFYVNTAREVVTVLLMFAKYLPLYLNIFICAYRGTHTQAHMCNQHTRGMATTRHKSLVEMGGRKAFARDKTALHTQKKVRKKSQETWIFSNSKKRIRAHRAPSKAARQFFTK